MTENKVAFSILHCVSNLISLVSMVLALVVGFMFSSCDKEMSTWLLVYGFMTPVICLILLVIVCLALPAIVLASKEEEMDDVVIISLLPSIICSIIVVVGLFIFILAWTIYGAVLFFPAASGPYPSCPHGQDGQVLVITGTVLVVLRFVFCCCPGFSVKRRSFSSDSDSPSGEWNVYRGRRMAALELGTIGMVEDDGVLPALVDKVPGVEQVETSGFVGLLILLVQVGRRAG